MATYFHGSSEIQADGLQTLYLMNPNYVGFSDTQQQQPPQPNMLFFNSAAGNNATLSHAPPPQNQHFFGIPLPTVRSAGSEDPNRPSDHEIPVLHGMVPRFHYNLGNPPHIHTVAATARSGGAVDVPLQVGFRRLVVSPTTQQGLSLSLSSQNPAYNPSLAAEHEISGQAPVTVISPARGNDMRGSGLSSSSASNGNGVSGIQNVILGSKYLKTAQQLLDEVVNVGNALQTHTGEGTKEKAKLMNRESMAETGDGPSTGEASSDCGAELTTAQKQELQVKKAKLLSMLDEVEQRYRQYHHQMEIVVSLFEQASGIGSAKSYTALALQTISKQFRCLKEAIATQIKATSKGLGEDDSLGGKGEGSRLKFADHQLRQQLGMIQQNAWRPQRGLPERAVSVLRAWLFEHFLHPYPKDSDKYMLAKQTGLTRSQVSNWFINARVRLWKPMVEEMYTEEMKDQEQNGSENNMSRSEPSKDSGSKSTAPQENKTFQMDQTYNLQSKQEKQIDQTASRTEIPNSTASTSPLRGSLQPLAGFTLIGSSEMEGIVQRSPKKPRSSDLQNSPSSILSMDMDMKPGATNKGINEIFGTERQTHESYSLIAGNASHGSGFGTYPIGDIGRFHGNSVSLTLGLPHCENLSLSDAQQSYLSNQNIQLGSRLDMGAVENRYSAINAQQPSHSNTDYENIDIQNRKRFAPQLLPDFVA